MYLGGKLQNFPLFFVCSKKNNYLCAVLSIFNINFIIISLYEENFYTSHGDGGNC